MANVHSLRVCDNRLKYGNSTSVRLDASSSLIQSVVKVLPVPQAMRSVDSARHFENYPLPWRLPQAGVSAVWEPPCACRYEGHRSVIGIQALNVRSLKAGT